MKQTAVEFLEEKLKGDKIFSLDVIITKAKEMEKQQIISAWENGYENGSCVNDETIYHGSRYFQKTFKTDNNEQN